MENELTNEQPESSEPPPGPKPRTEAQIAAARLNGAKSRGPITEEGKAASSQNSRTHGLLANTLLIEAESQEDFDRMLLETIAEFEPQTPAELSLATEMVACKWRQMRVWGMDAAGINDEIRDQAEKNPELLERSMPSRAFHALAELSSRENLPDKLHRYETRFSRTYFRLFNTLNALKDKREKAIREI